MVHYRIEVGEPLIISCVFHPLEILFPFFFIISYATCIILLFIHPKKWNSHPLEPSMSDHQLRPDIVQWNITVKEKAFFWNRHHMWTCRCIMSDEESSCFLGATFYLCGGDLKVSSFSVVTIIFFLKKKYQLSNNYQIINFMIHIPFILHVTCFCWNSKMPLNKNNFWKKGLFRARF